VVSVFGMMKRREEEDSYVPNGISSSGPWGGI